MVKTFAMFLGALFGVLQLSSVPVYGQTPSTDASQNTATKSGVEEFEVATIKPGAIDVGGISLSISPGGRVRIEHWTLKSLICAAYNLSYWQVQGGPAWIEKDLFDVEAKPPDPNDGAPVYNVHHDNWSLDDPKLRSMLQALLKERFRLRAQLAVKDGSVYVLEKSDRDLALTLAKHPISSGGGGSIGFARGVGIFNTTMPQFAAFIGGAIFHETVIDKTGLEGSYDFQSRIALTSEEFQNLDADSIHSLFLQAVKEMGLKLTRSTGPVTTLVIDSATPPSAN
jgi:uncharacterized protein (TIGR03435 family)